MPKRPRAVPSAAVWVDGNEPEWELAPKDARGRNHGKVTWWRPDGTLLCECEYDHGVEHGACVRYHPDGSPSRTNHFVRGKIHGIDASFRSAKPTTELAFPTAVLGKKVWRYEVDRDMDRVLAARCFDKKGKLVSPTGEPLPKRPPNVPERATYLPHSEEWIDGETDDKAQRHGLWCTWHRSGAYHSRTIYEHGEAKRLLEPDDASYPGAVAAKPPTPQPKFPAARRNILYGTDCAGDWLDDLDEEPKLQVVERALKLGARAKPRYTDVDDCEAVVAATGVLVQLLDGGTGPLHKQTLAPLSAALSRWPKAKRAALVKTAQRAMEFAVNDAKRSELCQMHEDDGPRSPWRKAIAALTARLAACRRG